MNTVQEKGMAKRVRLHNEGSKVFDYEILGTRYTIEPGKSIELPRRTAVAVRGFYPGKGIEINLRFELIEGNYDENVELATNKEKVVSYACYKCESEFSKKEDLALHMKEKHTPGPKV